MGMATEADRDPPGDEPDAPHGGDGSEATSGDDGEVEATAGPPAWRSDPDLRRFALWLAPILALALAVRVAFILIRQSKAPMGGGDAFWYHMQAKLVARGEGFLHPFEYFIHGRTAPGADHPPGMTLILAALDLVGIDSPQGQRLCMALVGVVSVAVIAFAGRRIGGPAVGLVAASLAAVYPNIWINDGMLMAETPFILGIAVAILCTYRYLDHRRVGDLLWVSAALTLAAMTRPEAVVLFPFFVTPVVLCRRELPWRRRWTHLAAAAAVPVVAFAPWLAYNLSRFEAPVLISTGAGQTLVVGNCDATYSGPLLGYWERKCLGPPYIDPPTETDLSLRDGEYQRIARRYILDHLSEVPKVVAARVGRLWHLYRVGDSIPADGYVEGRAGGEPGTGLALMREAIFAYYVLVAFGVAGLVVLRRRRVPVYPLLAQFALATFVAAITFGITRYRAGAEVALVLLAAVGMVAAWRALSSQRVAGPEGSAGVTGPA